MIRRELNPETRVIDEKAGIVEYIASDQGLDAQNEVVRSDGWRFDRFAKNSPLVDSHKYGSVGSCVGKVIDFRVVGRQLVETAQWAIDVAENQLARLGWAMTKAGYLKAVSVGFQPEVLLTRVPQEYWPEAWGRAKILPAASKPGRGIWADQVKDLALAGKEPDTIYVTQQQLELSACVLGSNPNALARSYKAGVLTDADMEMISKEYSQRETVNRTNGAAAVRMAQQRSQKLFLERFERALKGF